MTGLVPCPGRDGLACRDGARVQPGGICQRCQNWKLPGANRKPPRRRTVWHNRPPGEVFRDRAKRGQTRKPNPKGEEPHA